MFMQSMGPPGGQNDGCIYKTRGRLNKRGQLALLANKTTYP